MTKLESTKTAEKTHIYFIPGLAAGREIFEYLTFPAEQYETHVLEWLVPEKNETLRHYANRMTAGIKHESPVLIGVSFGGVVAQEMSMGISLKKLIIISSIKTRHEMPVKFHLANKIKVYKLMPVNLLLKSEDLLKFAIGAKTKKKLALYQKYLSVRNKDYIEWAIRQMLCWEREIPVKEVYHIHGDKDPVFPIKNIKNPIVVSGGTHVMIMYKAKILADLIAGILENNTV